MSNFLAIATITASVQQIVRESVVNRLPGAEVTTLRPDELSRDSNLAGVNVYLFQASPNPALRNSDLPVRDSEGIVVQRPTTALDLHYLFTYFGKEEKQEPEQLLALTCIAMNQAAVLGRDRITRTIASAPSEGLAGSDLASQQERVRFTPYPLTIQEIHQLWTVFSPVPYRLSNVYVASVVLLDGDEVPEKALPVSSTRFLANPTMPPKIREASPTRISYSSNMSVQLTGDNFINGMTAFANDGI